MADVTVVGTGAMGVPIARNLLAAGFAVAVFASGVVFSGEEAVQVNLATISPDLAQEAAVAHAQQGVGYVPAPMFGGVSVAEAGRLNIVIAGDAALVERVRLPLEVVSAGVWPVGEQPRQANVVKVAGQLVIAAAKLSALLTETIQAGREQQDWASLAEVQRHRDITTIR